MSRWKAALIHLTLSILVVGTVAVVLIALWYGWELFALMGGLKLLTILAICDVTIGPLLTLIVFKSGKPSLKFDLSVIAALQLAFLGYGLLIMAQSRPAFLVGLLDRFELVFANELAPEDLAKGPSAAFSTLSWTGPRLVGGQLPRNSQEEMELAMSGFAGKDIHLMPERYLDYEAVAGSLVRYAKPVQDLITGSPAAAPALENAINGLNRDVDSLVYVPINSRRGRAVMLLEAGTGKVLRPVAVEPWYDLTGQ